MDVWFCLKQELSPRGKNRKLKNLKKLFTRSSVARRESFCPLDKDLSWMSGYPCRLRRSMQHLHEVYSPESESLKSV